MIKPFGNSNRTKCRVTIYTYDAAGNRETETLIKGETRTEYIYTYNEQNRLTDITTKVNNVTIIVTSYIYDHNGNQLTKHEITNGVEEGTTTYKYIIKHFGYSSKIINGR